MKRMFGMMPRNEIEKEVKFKDNYGLTIIIQAGKNGWTILYPDHSLEYKDVEDTTENNFNEAFSICTGNIGKLIPVKSKCEEN